MSMLRMAWDLLRPTFQPTIDRYLAGGGASDASDEELALLLFGTLVMRLTPEYLRYQLQHAVMPYRARKALASWFEIQLPLCNEDQLRGLYVWTHAILGPYQVQIHHEYPAADEVMVEREPDDGEYDGPAMLGPRGILDDQCLEPRRWK